MRASRHFQTLSNLGLSFLTHKMFSFSIILYNSADGILVKSPFAVVPGSPRAVKYFRQSIFVTSYHKHTVYRFDARTGSPQGKFTQRRLASDKATGWLRDMLAAGGIAPEEVKRHAFVGRRQGRP